MDRIEFARLLYKVVDDQIKPNGKRTITDITHAPMRVEIGDDPYMFRNKHVSATYDPIWDKISIRSNTKFKCFKLFHEMAHKAAYDTAQTKNPSEFSVVSILDVMNESQVLSAKEEIIADLVAISMCLKFKVNFSIPARKLRTATYLIFLEEMCKRQKLDMDDVIDDILDESTKRYKFIKENYNINIK